jgi:uncharacterized protein (DUF433 family)
MPFLVGQLNAVCHRGEMNTPLCCLFAPLADCEYSKAMTQELKSLLDEVVWVDPDRMSGQPGFKGTRVPVQALIDHIKGNSTLDDFLKGFPSVSREQAIRFIELAKENLLACVSS